MTKRRQVSADEQALWRSVTRSVLPLRSGRATADVRSADHDRAVPARPVRSQPSGGGAAHQKPAALRQSPEPVPLSLDRRAMQRLARGATAIDARIDLHGRSQAEAHAALRRFLQRAQAGGARTVLVITGKGAGAGTERGVLRRQVPLWLVLPEFRVLVVGFGPAGVAHGGEGALYVRLRRAAPHPTIG